MGDDVKSAHQCVPGDPVPAPRPGEPVDVPLLPKVLDKPWAMETAARTPAGVNFEFPSPGRRTRLRVLSCLFHSCGLLLVIAGDGTLGTPEGSEPLAQGRLVWLPRGSTRSITAHSEGLSYLTVHRRRPSLQIRSQPPRDGTTPAY